MKVFSSRSFRKDKKIATQNSSKKKTKKRKQRQKQRQIGTSLRMYKFTTPNRISKATSDSHLCMKKEEEGDVVVALPRSQPCQKVKHQKKTKKQKAVEEHERNTRPQ